MKLGDAFGFFKSRPENVQKISPLRREQEGLFSQYQQALQGSGAGGAFGDAADYYRSLLGGGQDEGFERPLMRQFQEDIMPGIAEQFAGIGSGGLSSSGFMQEAGRASTDLAERLGQIRASLRQQGAQGLAGLAQGGLQPIDELLFRPREASGAEKLLTELAGGVGSPLGIGVGRPLGSALSKRFLEK